ncbi:unnamed protein product, partial [Mesorhabditis spiculigera]
MVRLPVATLILLPLLAHTAAAFWNPFSSELPCASCDSPIVIKPHGAVSGNITFKVDLDSNGCMQNTLTCRANDSDSPAIIEFNHGSGGILQGLDEISVTLLCNKDSTWTAIAHEQALDVISLSCDSA